MVIWWDIYTNIHYWLVVEPPTSLKNYGVSNSWDDEIPNIWKNNPNVPKHQPDYISADIVVQTSKISQEIDSLVQRTICEIGPAVYAARTGRLWKIVFPPLLVSFKKRTVLMPFGNQTWLARKSPIYRFIYRLFSQLEISTSKGFSS